MNDEWHVRIGEAGADFTLLPLSDPQWHVLRRASGSVSVYWTTTEFDGHAVAWDSLDDTPMPDALRRQAPLCRLVRLLLGEEAII